MYHTVGVSIRIGIESDKDPFARETHIDVIVSHIFFFWIVSTMLVLVGLDRQHGIPEKTIMIDPAAERAIAVRGKDGFVVDEPIEMVVDIVANHDLFALGADLGRERIVWEQVLEAPRTIIPIFWIGTNNTSNILA